jgi:hypothetical protein
MDMQEANGMTTKVQEWESDIKDQSDTKGMGDAQVGLERRAGLEQDEDEDGEDDGDDGTGAATNQ